MEMKKGVLLVFVIAVGLYLTSCSNSYDNDYDHDHDYEDMGHYVKIYFTKDGKSGWYYEIFQPSIPKDVPDDIYSKLWAIHLKTIKAGKYDYIALNSNTTHWIVFDESALSDDFTFEGVCSNYADYFMFILKYDEQLLELYNKGVIRKIESTSANHAWIEYHTENNIYIIDPTWNDWDFVGTPLQHPGNIEFAEACRGPNGNKLIEANSKEWFFRNVKTITKDYDKKHHNL